MGEFHTHSCCDHVIVTWKEALFWVVPLNRSPEGCVRNTWGSSVGPQSGQCWEDTKNWGHPGPKVAGRISWWLHRSPSRLFCGKVTCSPTPGPNTCWAAASRACVGGLGLGLPGPGGCRGPDTSLLSGVPFCLVPQWSIEPPPSSVQIEGLKCGSLEGCTGDPGTVEGLWLQPTRGGLTCKGPCPVQPQWRRKMLLQALVQDSVGVLLQVRRKTSRRCCALCR